MSVGSEAFKKKERVYFTEKGRHPNSCYGLWPWIRGPLKVVCQGCGYTMKIDSQTMQPEHLPMDEAVKNWLELKDNKTLAGDWK